MHKIFFSCTMALSKYSSDTSELFKPISNQNIAREPVSLSSTFPSNLNLAESISLYEINKDLADAFFYIFVSAQLI